MLLSTHLAMLVVEVTVTRHVLQALRERQAQLAARVDLAREHFAKSISRRVTQIPCMYDRRHLVGPRHRDTRPALRDDDRALVHRRDLAHKLVRPARERERVPVVTRSLPVRVQTDDGDDRVSLLRELDGSCEEFVGVLDLRTAETDAAVGVHECFDGVPVRRCADVHVLDMDLVGDTGLELEHSVFLSRATVEEALSARLFGPVVDDKLVIDEELGAARGEETKLEVGILVVGLERTAEPEGETLGELLRVVVAVFRVTLASVGQ